MPSPLDKREKNILQLVEWARIQGLNIYSKRTYRTLCKEARKQFLITEDTARDYAGLALEILSDNLRTTLELAHMRKHRPDRE